MNEHQLEIMRRTYPGFAKLNSDVRKTQADEKKYRDAPGYENNPAGNKNTPETYR